MGTILASALIAQVSEIAQDDSNVTWTVPQALAWLNEGQKTIAGMRPDASVSVESVQLVEGTKQTVTGRRLMDVIRNMGASGTTPGKAIRLVERGVKDDFDLDWHAAATSTTVQEYIYDVRIPDEYYVSPPIPSTPAVYVEISQSTIPDDVAVVGNAITISDIYSPHLIEWIAFRFFCRDAEEVPDAQRAASHFTNFFNLMGEKLNVDLAISPKVRAQLDE